MTPLNSSLAIFLATGIVASGAAITLAEACDLADGSDGAVEMELAQLGSEKLPGGVELRPSGAESARPMAPAPTSPGMAPPPPATAPVTTPATPPAKTEEKGEPKTRSMKLWSPTEGSSVPGSPSGGDERRPGGVERAPTRE